MDSKVVNREIRQRVWPALRALGFSRFSSRTAWRYTPSRIEVLNFQSFNSYTAGVIGCTTYSFSLNLGSYLLEIPSSHGPGHPKEKDGALVPEEYECHLRGRLHRSFPQRELDRRDIWYVDPAGKYLEDVFQDVTGSIGREGVSWFNRLRDPRKVYAVLLSDSEDMEHLWGFGRNPSPIRSYLVGYMAKALREWDVARSRLDEALQSGCFKVVGDRLAEDIGACRPTMG
jgi:hypothetical protein